MMNVFIDTNILIDFVCSRDPFYADAEAIFANGLASKINIYFTDISVINTLYVGKKYSYSVEELSSILKDVLEFCNLAIIDTNIMLNALSSDWRDKEDATQYFSAVESCADVFITRNVKDFVNSKIKVLTPVEFLQGV